MLLDGTLPDPHLNARLLGARCIPVLTDDALFERTGIRIAFTGRAGGESEGAFASLNLGDHVNDNVEVVERNRNLLLEALEAPEAELIVPHQVHGSDVVRVLSADVAAIDEARILARRGADALVVEDSGVAALLCYADCVPVIVVSPTGRFAVIHAGWRGAVACIASKAVRMLAQADQSASEVALADSILTERAGGYSAYIGPHIRSECFETGEEVKAQFVEKFGFSVLDEGGRVSLACAVTADLVGAGLMQSHVVDAGICTVCHAEEYYSYRASGGTCGRHGALAVRQRG